MERNHLLLWQPPVRLIHPPVEVTQYCHLLKRQGDAWLSSTRLQASQAWCLAFHLAFLPIQSVCPLFSKQGLIKVMTEHFFAKSAKHTLSPETKWFQFPAPSPPSCLQDNPGGNGLCREQVRKLQCSILPQPTEKPALFFFR